MSFKDPFTNSSASSYNLCPKENKFVYSSQNGLLPKLNKGSSKHHHNKITFLKRTVIKFKSQYSPKK